MSMYKQFGTDKNLEKSGVKVDYGTYRVTLARAGGANKKFGRVLEAKTRPYKRAIQTESMDADLSDSILREAYAESVVLNWEVKVEDKWKKGIEGPDGKIHPVSVPNVLRALEDLPDLFIDLQSQANKARLYLTEIMQADAGN